MKKLFFLIFLISCSQEIPWVAEKSQFSQKHFWLEDNQGEKSQIFVRQTEDFYHFIWLSMMKAPIARKFLRIKNCRNKNYENCAYFENDGFLPPNKKAEQVFLALLENIDKENFEIKGKFRVKDATLSKPTSLN